MKRVISEVFGGTRKIHNKRVEREIIDRTSLRQLAIFSREADIQIVPHEQSHIEILLETYDNGPLLQVTETNHKVEINVVNKNHRSFIFLHPLKTCQLTVKLPKECVEQYQMHTSSGEVTIRDILAESLMIGTSSGDMRLEDVVVANIELKGTSGDMVCNHIKTDQLVCSASSGDIALSEIDGDIKVEVSSGNMKVSTIRGRELVFQATSGNVNVKGIRTEKLTCQATSGNITGTHVFAHHIHVRVTSGDVQFTHFNGEVTGGATSGDIKLQNEQAYACDVNATSGDITVHLGSRDLHAEINLQTKSGDIVTNLPLKRMQNNWKEVSGTIGAGTFPVTLRSSSGDLTVYTK